MAVAPPSSIAARHLVKYAAALGLLITIGLTYVALDSTLAREKANFDGHMDLVSDLIRQRMRVTENSTVGLARLFNSSLHVDADQFRWYAEAMLQRHPFLTSVYYLPMVRDADREAFEFRMRRNGYTTFVISDRQAEDPVPAPSRTRYFPVVYVEPLTPVSAAVLGFDASSDPAFQTAIRGSIRSGTPLLSGPAGIMGGRPGFVVFLALYSGKNIPDQVSERARDVNGLVALGFDPQAMIADLPGLESLELWLRDAPTAPSGTGTEVVYHRGSRSDPETLWMRLGHSYVRDLNLGERPLTLIVRKAFSWQNTEIIPPLLALLAGLIVTGLLIVLARSTRTQTSRLESRNREINGLVQQRTRELAREKRMLEEEMRRRQQAQDESLWLGRLLDESFNEIYVFDAESYRFVKVNQGAQRNLGYTAKDMHAMSPWEIQTEYTEQSFQGMVQPLVQGHTDHLVFETTHRRSNGSAYPVQVRLSLSRTTGRALFVAMIEDITERARIQKHLRHLAHHDVLTGLPNRALFVERLNHSIVQARRHHVSVAILFLDLDRFKLVNDTLGHEAGDRLLREVARVLRNSVRESDTVARLGGDEFTILLEDLKDEVEATAVVGKIKEALQGPIRLGEQEIYVTTSIGIATFPRNGKTAESLLKNADSAMYRAKHRGRNTHQIYQTEIGETAMERLILETTLRQAVEHREFALQYQPQIDLETGKIVCMEALLRWQHPQRGPISPHVFIPLLEENGMINDVGDWVLRTACKSAVRWRQHTHRPVRVAVNLSARQFTQPDLTARIHRILERTGLDPHLLELELTETLVMQDADRAVEVLNELSRTGIRLAVDDFGTGYCSLNYLKRFPLTTLKIDRSFIADLERDEDDAAIVNTVISMAHSLKLEAVAEGVETLEQARVLEQWSCYAAQGYLFSRPVHDQRVSELLVRTFSCEPDRVVS